MSCEIERDAPITKTEKAALGLLALWPLLLVYALGALCAGCVNCYTRCPGTHARIYHVYQSTGTAAAASVVTEFPQMMSDGPGEGPQLYNLLTIPLGCVVLADAVCEAAVDTVCLPADIPLHYYRKGEE